MEEKELISKFLIDLSFVVDLQRPSWYPPTTTVFRNLGLKWVNKILVSFNDVVFKSTDMIAILKFNLISTIKKI